MQWISVDLTEPTSDEKYYLWMNQLLVLMLRAVAIVMRSVRNTVDTGRTVSAQFVNQA